MTTRQDKTNEALTVALQECLSRELISQMEYIELYDQIKDAVEYVVPEDRYESFTQKKEEFMKDKMGLAQNIN